MNVRAYVRQVEFGELISYTCTVSLYKLVGEYLILTLSFVIECYYEENKVSKNIVKFWIFLRMRHCASNSPEPFSSPLRIACSFSNPSHGIAI
jgi:hypothetical protein